MREQDLVVFRAGVVEARHVLSQQHGPDAGHLGRGRSVAFSNSRPRVKRADGPGFQEAGGLIIRVNRFASDVFVSALVRNVLPASRWQLWLKIWRQDAGSTSEGK